MEDLPQSRPTLNTFRGQITCYRLQHRPSICLLRPGRLLRIERPQTAAINLKQLRRDRFRKVYRVVLILKRHRRGGSELVAVW